MDMGKGGDLYSDLLIQNLDNYSACTTALQDYREEEFSAKNGKIIGNHFNIGSFPSDFLSIKQQNITKTKVVCYNVILCNKGSGSINSNLNLFVGADRRKVRNKCLFEAYMEIFIYFT